MSSIPDADDVRQHADDLFTPATDLAPDSSPAVPFTEDQALDWLKSNGRQSVRWLARLWGWHPSKVFRLLQRVDGETPETVSGTPPTVSAKSETPTETPRRAPEPPGPPEPDPNEFNFKRSECVLPLRTAVWAYVDDVGDLRISAEDAKGRCDTELRINAEDIEDFLLGLNGIWQEAQERGQP
jgi:hypothetical protein